MIDVKNISEDSVGLGSTIVVYDVNNDEKIRYHLVTSEETDVPNTEEKQLSFDFENIENIEDHKKH